VQLLSANRTGKQPLAEKAPRSKPAAKVPRQHIAVTAPPKRSQTRKPENPKKKEKRKVRFI